MEVRCKRFVIATQFPRTIICAVLVDRRIHSIDCPRALVNVESRLSAASYSAIAPDTLASVSLTRIWLPRK